MSNSKDTDGTPRPKLVLAKLTPQMTPEQQKQNLIAALRKQGIVVRPGPNKDKDETK